MTNEQYLIISYIAVGLISFGIGVFVYLWLRNSLTGIADNLETNHFSLLLRRLFPIGIILPALAGFFSVSFRSCSKGTYQKIITDRAYLIERNQEQLSATLDNISIALLVWCFLLLIVFLMVRQRIRDKCR
jgi:hypothetical protein